MNDPEDITTLCLPFSLLITQIEETEAGKNILGRKEDALIDPGIERGALFFLMDEHRDKGGGFKRRKPEALVLMGEVYWPFWAVPQIDKAVLVDGLNLLAKTYELPTPVDPTSFNELMNSESADLFLQNLKKSRDALQNFNKIRREKLERSEIKALLPSSLVKELCFLLKFGTKKEENDQLLLTPHISAPEAVKIGAEVNKVLQHLQKNINATQQLKESISEKAKDWTTNLEQGRSTYEEELQEELLKLEASVNQTIRQLENERDQRLQQIEVEKQTQRENLSATKWQILSEPTLFAEELSKINERYQSLKRDDFTYHQLLDQTEELNRDLQSLVTKISKQSEEIETFIKQTKESNRKIEEESEQNRQTTETQFQAQKEEELRKIEQFNIDKQRKLDQLDHKISQINSLTSELLSILDALRSHDESMIHQVETDILPLDLIHNSSEAPVQVRLPFFCCIYSREGEDRHLFVPPQRIVKGMKPDEFDKSFGALPLVSLSEVYDKLASLLHQEIQENNDFRVMFQNLITKGNQLRSEQFRNEVQRGLEHYQVYEWIKKKEFEELLVKLSEFR